MKILFQHRPRSRAGYALLMVLTTVAILLTLLAATMSRTRTSTTLNDRSNHYGAGLYAAEAATEKVIARMQFDFLNGNLTYLGNDLSIYQSTVPTAADSPYWGQFQFSDGQGHADQVYVGVLSNAAWGPLDSQYAGLNGFISTYRILANAREPASFYPITNAVQQDVQFYGIPIFQFAIFYNNLLEFTWCAPFTINGRVHSNTNIFVGSSAALTFNTTVTAAGTVSSPAWFGKSTRQYTGRVSFNGNPGYSTNVNSLTLPIGTNNSPAVVREIVNMPPAGEDPNSPMGQQRYYNKAGIVLLVGNSAVTVTLKNSSTDPLPTTITAFYSPTNLASTNFSSLYTNFPFLSITNGNAASPRLLTFIEQREDQKTVLTSQIDIGKLAQWLTNNAQVNAKFPNVKGNYNAGVYPNILYVADLRTMTRTNITAVRLMDAQVIPANVVFGGKATGFTVATPNPLYIWGYYNSPNGLGAGTNTSATYPSSLISDALTILSPHWADSGSSSAINGSAASDIVNAAILTGIVNSTGSDVNSFSGGAMNLPRLLEDWSGATLNLNTSIVNLYNSVVATNQFQQPGVYYYAPGQRVFSFDQNFTKPDGLPPGTPMLGALLRSKWTVPPPDTVTYAGN